VVESLQAGYPLLALHCMQYEDWGLVVGYAREGQVLLCQTPHNDSPAEARHWPWLVLRITDTGPLPGRLEWVQESLHTAVCLFETERFGPLYCGAAAYRLWIAGLREADFYRQQGEPGEAAYAAWIAPLLQAEADSFAGDLRYHSDYIERAHVNNWRMASLSDARRAAAAYLDEVAPLFDGQQRERLQQAGRLYARVTELLCQAQPHVVPEWRLGERPWTQPMRQAQADLLEQALQVETQAVEVLKAV
jgi:hypothetical protein